MKRDMRKISKTIIRIFFIIFILIYTIPFPINRQLDAVEIKIDDPSYLDKRKIHISGTYRFNLFADNTFRGQISVTEYELTWEKMAEVEFVKSADNGGILEYKYEIGTDESGRPLTKEYLFGRVFLNPRYRNIVIMLYEQYETEDGGYGGRFDSKSGYCIISSVDDREGALKVLEIYGILPH